MDFVSALRLGSSKRVSQTSLEEVELAGVHLRTRTERLQQNGILEGYSRSKLWQLAVAFLRTLRRKLLADKVGEPNLRH